jgi:hypothetical protein
MNDVGAGLGVPGVDELHGRRRSLGFVARRSLTKGKRQSGIRLSPFWKKERQTVSSTVRPVSAGISCHCFQHIQILETVQKSFIPMKLSLLP